MLIRSRMKEEVTYRKSVGDIVIKPMTVTEIDENIVSAEELINCYGDRISVVEEEPFVEPTKENIKQAVNDLKDLVIEGKVEPVEGAEMTKEEVIEGLNSILEVVDSDDSKLDNLSEVKDFLEGETDNLPEGTEIISDEEAKKLEAKKLEAQTKTEVKKATKGKNKGNKKK